MYSMSLPRGHSIRRTSSISNSKLLVFVLHTHGTSSTNCHLFPTIVSEQIDLYLNYAAMNDLRRLCESAVYPKNQHPETFIACLQFIRARMKDVKATDHLNEDDFLLKVLFKFDRVYPIKVDELENSVCPTVEPLTMLTLINEMQKYHQNSKCHK